MAATSTLEAGVTLGTPLADEAVRDINFFNGRLLTGGDLQREQAARQLADRRVGAAFGAGIAWGLEVSVPPGTPAGQVKVTCGLGVGASGLVLKLATEAALHLVAPPPEATVSVAAGFGPCGTLAGASGVAGSGLFLLTLAPLTLAEGKAPVLALDAVNTRCSTDAWVEAVQFRLLRINGYVATGDSAAAVALLRSQVAAAFLAPQGQAAAHAQPGSPALPAGLLVQMAKEGLSECDIPLAVVYMKDEAVVFVDRWAVRRRLAAGAASAGWAAWLGERVQALGEAQLLQFQDHIVDTPALLGGAAAASLAWLPPAGFLPATTSQAQWRLFLGLRAPGHEVLLAAADAPDVLAGALRGDAVDLASPVGGNRYRVYRVGGAGGPLLFVRDARNVHHAEQVWVDGDDAGLPGVNEVQSALRALRAGCCRHVVLRPDMSEATLAQLARGLAKQDVTLCFEPGRYRWSRPLRLAGLKRLRVQGPGAVLVNEKGACALRIVDCEAAEVRDIEIEGGVASRSQAESGQAFEGALTIIDTPEVDVQGVRATCANGRKPDVTALWLAITDGKLLQAGGTRATVSRCELRAGEWQQGLFMMDFEQTHVLGNQLLPADKGSAHQIGAWLRGLPAGVVQVHDNLLRGVAWGLEVMLEPASTDPKRPPPAGRVSVQRNRLELNLEVQAPSGVHGILVRGVRSATVSANHVVADEDAARKLELRAIWLPGQWGAQLLVRDNLFVGCPRGIAFEPSAAPPYFAWVFQCNVALGLRPEVLLLPEGVEGIVDENNKPVNPRNLR